MKSKSKNSDALDPSTSPAAQDTCAASYGKLFGDKLIALRGSLTAAELAKRTDLSRETIRKAEHGIEATLSTLRTIRTVLGLNETEWTDWLGLWFKFQLGKDAEDLNVKVSPSNVAKAGQQTHHLPEIILDHIRAFDAELQTFLVEIVRSKDRVAALWKFANLIPESQKSVSAVEPYDFPGVEDPPDGLWATL